MTKREKRLQYVRNRIKRLEKDQHSAIKMLVHAYLQLPELRKEEGRLETVLAKRRGEVPPSRMMDDGTIVPDTTPVYVQEEPEPKDDGLDIPEKFRRNAGAPTVKPEVYEAAKAVANAHNAPPTPEQKKLVEKEKRKVKEEHKHALLTGQKRKWPVSGRAALAQLK